MARPNRESALVPDFILLKLFDGPAIHVFRSICSLGCLTPKINCQDRNQCNCPDVRDSSFLQILKMHLKRFTSSAKEQISAYFHKWYSMLPLKRQFYFSYIHRFYSNAISNANEKTHLQKTSTAKIISYTLSNREIKCFLIY